MTRPRSAKGSAKTHASDAAVEEARKKVDALKQSARDLKAQLKQAKKDVRRARKAARQARKTDKASDSAAALKAEVKRIKDELAQLQGVPPTRAVKKGVRLIFQQFGDDLPVVRGAMKKLARGWLFLNPEAPADQRLWFLVLRETECVLRGTTLTVKGTTGDDTFVVSEQTDLVVTVNGVSTDDAPNTRSASRRSD